MRIDKTQLTKSPSHKYPGIVAALELGTDGKDVIDRNDGNDSNDGNGGSQAKPFAIAGAPMANVSLLKEVNLL